MRYSLQIVRLSQDVDEHTKAVEDAGRVGGYLYAGPGLLQARDLLQDCDPMTGELEAQPRSQAGHAGPDDDDMQGPDRPSVREEEPATFIRVHDHQRGLFEAERRG